MVEKMHLESITCPRKSAGEAYRHTHDEWEFIITSEGEGIIVVDGTSYPFQEGTVVCVPPGALHYNWSENRYSHIAIRFTGFENPTTEPILAFQDDAERTFESLAKIMLRLFYSGESGNAEVLDALCTVLCTLLVNSAGARKAHPQLEAFKQAVALNFMDPEFTVSDAYGALNYSEGHFRKLFREQTGMSPVHYLTECRLAHAKRMLEQKNTGGAAIGYIALRSGFYDQRYFARLFKQRFGMTPQAYRKEALSVPDP